MDGRPKLGRTGLLDRLESLLDADRVVFATAEGQITDQRSVPDNSIRLRALNMALSLRDEFPARAGLAVGVSIHMERLPDLSHLTAHELTKLADEGESESEPLMLGSPAQTNGAVTE